ncbi:MBL fold metallo-hydrolase [Akkermansiaceae bacterium]|nr:MBL fold metallo-hydrolase [Akkermansiaceae bacterium]
MPLEDDVCDVIGKAMHGLGLSLAQLAKITNLPEGDINTALTGQYDDRILKQMAATLELSPSALIGLPSYQPDASAPDGLVRIVSPFGHAGVNAYLIIMGQHALAFDTGTDADLLIEYLEQHQLVLDALYITHRHHDHIAGIQRFEQTRIIYPEDTQHGQTENSHSGNKLTAIDVSGHMNPAKAYYYDGLSVPVCIIGDSVFAGSMGKSPDSESYKLALKTAKENLMTLSSNTVLCPGHGPLTTVGLEKVHNAFLGLI